MIHFFPPEVPQLQNRYLCKGLFNILDSEIHDIICRFNDNVEYLKHLPPSMIYQVL